MSDILDILIGKPNMTPLNQADENNPSVIADATMDRISYDSYKIDIESADPTKDISMREVYGLDPAQAK